MPRLPHQEGVRGSRTQAWTCPCEARGLRREISSKQPSQRFVSDQRPQGLGVGLGAETQLRGTQMAPAGYRAPSYRKIGEHLISLGLFHR